MKLHRTILTLALSLSGPARAADLPPHVAADPSAAVVTAQNLLASDRFWPYRVTLAAPLERPGAAPLAAGETGVLIRVEDGAVARVDFGRDGLYDVPIAKTDLVASANRVRTGELEKVAPHFVLAIGPRLIDPVARKAPDLGALSEQRAFLAFFADPEAPDFAAQVRALAPLRERAGVATIFFPQGHHPDAEVIARLETLGWLVPFVRDHLSEAYTRTLLDDGVHPPAVVLQTNEGRVLVQRAWSADVGDALAAALDAK